MLINATEREKQFIEEELLSHRKSGGVLDVVVVPENADELELSSGFEASTLLHVAAKYGNVEATRYLIDNGYDVDTPNLSKRTALLIAMHHAQIEIVNILIKVNAKICLCDKSGGGHEATCALNGVLARPILNKIRAMFCRDSEDLAKHLLEYDLPLSAAVYLGDTSTVRYMLDNGRAVDERDSPELRRSALHYAVFLENLSMVNLLLDRGLDVNAVDASGATALFSYNTESEDTDEKLEMLRTLLNRGASLTTSGDDVVFPIHLFCMRGKRRTVRIILEYNNDLIASGKNGLSDLHFLTYNKNEGIVDELKNLDIGVLFDQITAAIIATCEGCAETLEFLLERGVIEKVRAKRVSLLNRLSKRPPKDAADVATRLKCLQLLLRYGDDVQHVCDDGETIFGNVLRLGNFYLANILVAHLVEELGEPIKEIILTTIDSDVRFKKYFGLCKGWLGKMKKTKICNSTTLFEFLTVDEKKMCTYARDPKVVAQLERIRYNQRRSDMYYCNLLRRRINAVLKYVELKKQVALIVPENCQLRYNDYLIEMIANFVGV